MVIGIPPLPQQHLGRTGGSRSPGLAAAWCCQRGCDPWCQRHSRSCRLAGVWGWAMQLGHQDQNVCARAAVGVPWFLKRQWQMLQLLTHIPCCLAALYETLVGPMCWQPCLTLGAGSHRRHQGRQQPALQDTSRTSLCAAFQAETEDAACSCPTAAAGWTWGPRVGSTQPLTNQPHAWRAGREVLQLPNRRTAAQRSSVPHPV